MSSVSLLHTPAVCFFTSYFIVLVWPCMCLFVSLLMFHFTHLTVASSLVSPLHVSNLHMSTSMCAEAVSTMVWARSGTGGFVCRWGSTIKFGSKFRGSEIVYPIRFLIIVIQIKLLCDSVCAWLKVFLDLNFQKMNGTFISVTYLNHSIRMSLCPYIMGIIPFSIEIAAHLIYQHYVECFGCLPLQSYCMQILKWLKCCQPWVPHLL